MVFFLLLPTLHRVEHVDRDAILRYAEILKLQVAVEPRSLAAITKRMKKRKLALGSTAGVR